MTNSWDNLKVLSDAKFFLEAFRRLLNQNKLPNFSSWGAWCREIGMRYHPRLEHKQHKDSPLNPYIVVDRIFRQLRNDDIIACGNARGFTASCS